MPKNFTELNQLRTFQERLAYLQLFGTPSEETFGSNRGMNQRFYKSREWRQIRDSVIVRDGGCDLGVAGYEINCDLVIHHISPITLEDIQFGSDRCLNPENLITTTYDTHNQIHFGNSDPPLDLVVVRSAGDTKLW